VEDIAFSKKRFASLGFFFSRRAFSPDVGGSYEYAKEEDPEENRNGGTRWVFMTTENGAKSQESQENEPTDQTRMKHGIRKLGSTRQGIDLPSLILVLCFDPWLDHFWSR